MTPPAQDADPTTYLWDFFGPRAAGTAAHFEQHLQGFLERAGIQGFRTGTESEGEGHTAAFCVVFAGAGELVERALRPQRKRA